MGTPYLSRVMANNQGSLRCGCEPWAGLSSIARDLTVYDFMRWARTFHHIELALLVRGERVAICDLWSIQPGHGNARKVLTELCTWADCAGVVLELSPTDQWGADLERLALFYMSLGFQYNIEPEQPLLVQEQMIRYPSAGRGHERL